MKISLKVVRDNFFKEYETLSHLRNLYTSVLEDVVFLYGASSIIDSSKFVGRNMDSIQKFNSSVKQMTGFINRNSAYQNFLFRTERLRESQRQISEYVQSLS